MKHSLDIKWLSLVLLNLVVIGFIVTKQPTLSGDTKALTALDLQLNAIQTQLRQPCLQPDLSPITQNMKQLGDFIQQLQNKDDHQLGDLFTTEQVAIKKQLASITDLLKRLDEQKHPINRLPASELPFKVLSIDSIQEVPVASIAYHHKTQAFEKGDSLAGWTILVIDFAQQTIAFENNEKSQVSLHLQEANHA